MPPAFLPPASSLEALGQSERQEARRRAGLGAGAVLEAVLETPRGQGYLCAGAGRAPTSENPRLEFTAALR